MKRSMTLFAVFGLLLLVAGCSSTGGLHTEQAELFGEKTLQASGYSQFDDSGRLNVNYRWLSAEQLAKLNAYRGLAHQRYRLSYGKRQS